jgi:hypothetical protein
MSPSLPSHLWIFLAVAVAVAGPSRAAAGIVMVTAGPTIKHLGDVPAAKLAAAQSAERDANLRRGRVDVFGKGMSRPAVGFRYNYFGLFWVEFWTWGGEFCLYEGTTAVRLSQGQAADLLGREPVDLRKPFNYSYPPGLLVLAGLAAIILPALLLTKRRQSLAKKLLDDPRYQHALDLLCQGKQSEEAFEEAVLSLQREGLSRDEAASKLRVLLAHLEQQQARQG